MGSGVADAVAAVVAVLGLPFAAVLAPPLAPLLPPPVAFAFRIDDGNEEPLHDTEEAEDGEVSPSTALALFAPLAFPLSVAIGFKLIDRQQPSVTEEWDMGDNKC